jgi:hypothetical protein
VLEGRQTRTQALERYGAFSDAHRWKYECMLEVQHLVPKLRPRLLDGMTRLFGRSVVSHWAFRHYLDIAPPSFALPAPSAARGASRSSAVAA